MFPCKESSRNGTSDLSYHCKRQHNKTTFKFKETKCHAYTHSKIQTKTIITTEGINHMFSR